MLSLRIAGGLWQCKDATTAYMCQQGIAGSMRQTLGEMAARSHGLALVSNTLSHCRCACQRKAVEQAPLCGQYTQVSASRITGAVAKSPRRRCNGTQQNKQAIRLQVSTSSTLQQLQQLHVAVKKAISPCWSHNHSKTLSHHLACLPPPGCNRTHRPLSHHHLHSLWPHSGVVIHHHTVRHCTPHCQTLVTTLLDTAHHNNNPSDAARHSLTLTCVSQARCGHGGQPRSLAAHCIRPPLQC